MAELPLAQGIDRFKQNEDRMDRFTNGSETQSFTTSGGNSVPSIRKFLKDKDSEINVAADGVLAQSQAARDAAQAFGAASEDASEVSIAARDDAIEARNQSQNWAEGNLPGGAGTKSAKEWAAESQAVFNKFPTPVSGDAGKAVAVKADLSGYEYVNFAESNAFVISIAALKAVDTTKVKHVYVTQLGRAGQFVWRAADYSSAVSIDPLEGVFVKATAVSANVGAWVRVFSGPLDIRWFGATIQGDPSATTAAIQRALNLASTLSAVGISSGKVLIPAGEWRLGKTTTETFQSVAMPAGQADRYALLIPTGVTLEGEGYKSVLKRYVSTPLWIAIMADSAGSAVRNLRLDGNSTGFPYIGDTYGSGGGVSIENGTNRQNENIVLDTLWIEDTPGYGVGIGWGNQRGVLLTNLFIKGTGSDGIDMKRVVNGAAVFDLYAVILDKIIVEDFGRTSTDDAAQAGVDLRGYFTASNIHVRKFGSAAQAGIRMRGGNTSDNAIGAQRSSLTNFRVERVSGGAAETYALEINPDFVQVSNGSVEGCTENVSFLLAGAATSGAASVVSNVRSYNAGRYGFRVRPQFRGVSFIGCADVQTATTTGNAAFYIEGLDTKLVTPYIQALSGLPACIRIVAGAQRTGIIQPTYAGAASATVVDGGTGTVTL